jgi:hypothetical protein
MRVSLLISLVIAFIIACTSVHGIKESDLSGFSINVPASNSNINSDNSNNMVVEAADQQRFQQVDAAASSSKAFAMADRQALAQALGESVTANKCPHWTESKELTNAPEDRRNPGVFLRTNGAENKELFVIGGYKSDTKTFNGIYKVDTKVDMNGAGAGGWKKVTPTLAENFNLEQNQVNRAKAAKVWFSNDGKKGDFVVFAAGNEENKMKPGEGIVYTVKANGDVSVAPMRPTAATEADGMPKARIGATLTKISDSTALLFGGESLEGNTLNDAWKLIRNGDGSYTWTKLPGTDAPSVRTTHTAAANEGKVYIFGGALKNGTPVDAEAENKGTVYVYDDAAATKWMKLAPAAGDSPSAGGKMSSFFLNGNLYVIGGCSNNDNCNDEMWKFTTQTKTWKKVTVSAEANWKPALRNGKAAALALSSDKAIYFAGCDDVTCDSKIAKIATFDVNGVCPGDCQNNGVYKNGKCECVGKFTGDRCENAEKLIEEHTRPITQCPRNCSNQGICLEGMCLCHKGFNGTDCSQQVKCENCTKKCPGEPKCSGHGACRDTGCVCATGYKGADCSTRSCPKDCSGNGKCNDVDGTCTCNDGFTGPGCAVKDEAQCPNNCTDADHGSCNEIAEGKSGCVCKTGWGGRDCSIDVRCPEGLTPLVACSGNGQCRAEKCVCNDGYAGFKCDKRSCPKDCSKQGKCDDKTGLCKCDIGFADEDCSRKLRCPNANETFMCNGRGECHEDVNGTTSGIYDGVCKCREPFTGASCELQPCKASEDGQECYGRGACDKKTGLCACEQGFAGQACELQCDKKCNNNGRCFAKTPTRPLCDCKPGFRGVSCQIQIGCPGNKGPKGACTGNGDCVRGVCHCFPGFSGDACDVAFKCGAKGCSNHGDCRHGQCHCHPGFSGEHCDVVVQCPKGCSGHGECLNGRCYCDAAFSGKGCAVPVECPKSCSERGICIRGKCECQMGFSGEACEVALQTKGCPRNCSLHGDCHLGKCFCHPNYEGHDCSRYITPKCPKGDTYLESAVCSDRGLCTVGGKCQCYPGYYGDDCSKAHKCPQDCNLRGLCFNKRCFCNPGFSGEFCERREPCPGTPECSDRGLCVNGECTCEPGYGGAGCEVVFLGKDVCPKGCSGNGLCQVGKCFCSPGFGGKDCSLPAGEICPGGGNCNGNGQCHHGSCFCNPGWTGEACDLVVPCAAGCSAHGSCYHGRCFCNSGWTGKNCSKQMEPGVIPPGNAVKPGNCPNGCSMHGICFRGECMCNAGYQGIDCSRKDDTWKESDRCPNDCRGSHAARAAGQYGLCLMGQCYCYPGFTGPSCQEVLPLRCPRDCSNRGICSYGKCFCDLGYTGAACENKKKCPLNCNGNGLCHHGQCDCNPGFSGDLCEKQTGNECKNGCSSHGRCYMGKCWCQPGYEGDDCSQLNYPNVPVKGEQPRSVIGGPNIITREAVGPVTSGAKYGSTQHAMEIRKLEDRLTHGPILSGAQFENAAEAKEHHKPTAAKDARFKASAVQVVSSSDKKCTLKCGKHGICVNDNGNNKCDCEPGFDGEKCEKALTCGPNACGGRGVCKYGTCFCNPGFTGPQCAEKVACENNCNSNGVCKFGKCFCNKGFEGNDCGTETQCPSVNDSPCTGHGVCNLGQCECDEAHEGADCAKKIENALQCTLDCNNRGLCHKGRCFCTEGFSGSSCEINLHDGAVDLSASNVVGKTPSVSTMRFGVLNVIIVAVGSILIGAVVNVAFNHLSNKRKEMLASKAINSKPLPTITQSSGFFMLDTEETPSSNSNNM